MTTRHTAEITDPLTGGITTLTATTAAELDQLVDAHLEQHYPIPPEEDPEPTGGGPRACRHGVPNGG